MSAIYTEDEYFETSGEDVTELRRALQAQARQIESMRADIKDLQREAKTLHRQARMLYDGQKGAAR